MNDKPYCGGQWTTARFRSFIKSALRAASNRWAPKWECINDSFVRKGKSAKGRHCKLHRCAHCEKLFPKGEMRADHIEPVVDPDIGFVDWNTYIERMFPERDGYQALCDGCHKIKTAEERKRRK